MGEDREYSGTQYTKGTSLSVGIIQVRADIILNVMDTCSYQAKDVKEEEEGNNRLRICKEVKQQHFIFTLFTKKLQYRI